MISFFQHAPADQSLYYLYNIFGSMEGVIPDLVGGVATGTTINLLGTMFRVFNSAILTVAVLLVVYVTIVGVVQTAHEGEFMGKKWNNIWIPIRTVIGVSALVPTASGFSAIQIILMWIIVQGVGAADVLWNRALTYVEVTGSPFGGVTLPAGDTFKSMSVLYQGLVCSAAARETRQEPTGSGGNYFCKANTCDGGAEPTISPNTNPTKTDSKGNVIRRAGLGPGSLSLCGEIQYCDETTSCANNRSIKCYSCRAQTKALQAIMTEFNKLAASFQAADFSYREFHALSYLQTNNPGWDWIYQYCGAQDPAIPQSECCIRKDNPLNTCKAKDNLSGILFPPNQEGNIQDASTDAVVNIYLPFKIKEKSNFIATASSFYTSAIATSVQALIEEQANRPLTGTLGDAQKYGWMLAGAYYHTVANMSRNNLTDAMPILSVTPMNNDVMKNYRNNFSAAGALIKEISESTGGISGMATPGVGEAGGAIDAALETMKNALRNAMKAPFNNSLYELWAAGNALLVSADLLFIGLVSAMMYAGAVASVNGWFAGFGAFNPLLGSYIGALFFLMPLVIALLGVMISLGGLLGIYTPIIPYIIFTLGAAGWLISVFEAMVAGPLVALGIISPSGQHELMGKAEPAIMLIFGIFLRPSLMIFGFIAAMFLAASMVHLVNHTFNTMMSSTPPFSATGSVLFLAAYVMLIVTVLNKSFQAIYLVPNQVMRWIGGHAEQGGEAEGLAAVKGGIDTAKGQAGSHMGKDVGRGSKMADKMVEQRRKSGAGATVSTPESGGKGGGEGKK